MATNFKELLEEILRMGNDAIRPDIKDKLCAWVVSTDGLTFEQRMLEELIAFGSKSELNGGLKCYAPRGPQGIEFIPCIRKLEYGRMLTIKEENSTCTSCKFLWHLSMARNELDK